MAIDRRHFLASLAACAVCSAAATPQAVSHWNYTDEGPDKWAGLDPKFGGCAAGDQQSPVDLHDGLRTQLPAINVGWKADVLAIVNNGHTLQLNPKPGSVLKVGDDQFDLLQFHFHTPSEHAVSGQRTAMEAHFVHQQKSGNLAVLGVLLVPGQRNDLFAAIMAAAPAQAGQQVLPSAMSPKQLLPKKMQAAWRYKGSLTTPPCSQIVDWIVLDETVSVAQADIAAFQKIFPMNARPLQPLNRRYLLRG